MIRAGIGKGVKVGIVLIVIIGIVLGLGAIGAFLGSPNTSGTSSVNAAPVTVTSTVPASTVTSTITTTITLGPGGATTTTITRTVTVSSLRFSPTALVNYTGSGDGSSPPFTATSAIVNVQASTTPTSKDITLSNVAWYIYLTNDTVSYVATGMVSGQSGTMNFTGYGLSPGGTYFLKVISANTKWNIVISASQ